MLDALDDLIGRWHQFADRSADQIESNFNEESRGLVREVVQKVLGDGDVDFESPAQFASYVAGLRENEREWSRQLAQTIVQAQSFMEEANLEAALHVFRDFEQQCPWRVFVEIAEAQRENTLSD